MNSRADILRMRSILNPLSYAKLIKNRVIVNDMQTTRVIPHSNKVIDPMTPISSSATTVAAFLIFMVAAAGLLLILSTSSEKSVILTLLSLFAMLGIFFVFAFVAGQIRFSERTPTADMLTSIAHLQAEGQLLTAMDGTILYANQAASDLLGRDEAGELQPLESCFTMTPSGAEILFRLIRANQRQEARSEVVMLPALKPGDSRDRWFRLDVKPFGLVDRPGYTGKAALWSFTEITDEKRQAGEQIKDLRSELAIYRQLAAGVCVFHADGAIRHINSNLLHNLGHAANAAPRHLGELLPRHSIEHIQKAVTHSPGQVSRGLDIDFITAAGERWPAECHVSAEQSSEDVRTAALIVHPRAAENDLDQDAEFGDIFRTAPFGIALVDAEGCLKTINPAFARLSGASFTTLIGKSVEQAFEFDADSLGASQLASSLDAARRGKAEIPAVEVATGQDGEFARRIFIQSLGRGKSENAPVILYVTDATEERELGQKFAQSQKMEAIGKLAGGIAHDFNNVLTAIIGFSDLLLANHRPSDHAYKNIQNIRSSANHAAGLVKQLLAFSRQQTLEPEILQLGELVTDLSVILNRLLGEKVDLKISSGRDLWAVKADRNQLNQVVINLAVNARDAMPEGGRLTVRTKNIGERESQKLSDSGVVVGQYVMIEVEDTGSGMPPEVMAKIFEPFFTTKDVGKGTGLGLSTVYGIIKQTGGYVFADSTPGRGTTFRVYLPRHILNDQDRETDTKVAPSDRPLDLTGHGRVLVVEDEDAVRIFATEALRRQGYEVLQACDGLEALDILEECNNEVDLVVSDVKMPEMDGPTLYKELRKTNPTIKFVFVSGYADDAFDKTLDANADYTFLQKPYTLAQIAEVVKSQLL